MGISRKWKTKRGTFLIEKNLEKIPHVYSDIGLEGGERFDDSAEYVETEVDGEIIKRYGAPRPFSIEDEMTVSDIHRVVGDRFYEFYYSHRFRSDPDITAKLLISDLELDEGALPFGEKNLFE